MHDSITPSGLPPTPLDPHLLCSPHPIPLRPQSTLMSPAFCFVYRSTVSGYLQKPGHLAGCYTTEENVCLSQQPSVTYKPSGRDRSC